MKCTKEIPDMEFDVVSVIHVLEHIEDPVEFLISLHDSLKPDGKLFIEVPDAIEFETLIPIHDEFNSCHTHFYDVSTLCRVLARSVYNVTDIHRKYYKERNLHRIMAVCQRGDM
jgi:2-polyprenyl-3-methyl-5-hydroxy-6-metoxy-1,4-benzoquinol methylase